MRRLVASAAALPILVLLLAAPAAAAPPVKDTVKQDFVFVVSTSCGPATCTDTFVDLFTVTDETMVVCLFQSTFNIHNGRLVSENGACSDEVSTDTLVIGQDLSSASLSPTDVTLLECDEQGCVEGDTVTISAELTAFGPTFTDKQRSTSSDGTCTFTFSSSGEQRPATGTLTIDGETVAADGNIGEGTFTFREHCR